jgi:kynurenine formamidase
MKSGKQQQDINTEEKMTPKKSHKLNIVDLSHTIQLNGRMPMLNPTIPQPKLITYQSHEESRRAGMYAEGISQEISCVKFITSIGTFVESPYSFFESRAAIDGMDISSFVLPGVAINCTPFVKQFDEGEGNVTNDQQEIPVDVLSSYLEDESEFLKDKAVLFYTGSDRFFKEQAVYSQRVPFIGRKLVKTLLDCGVKLVGIDTMNADSAMNTSFPVHCNLLKNDIPIVQNLCHLDRLLQEGRSKSFIFHAAPVKFERAPSFPVRAYAVLQEQRSTA